MMIDIVFKDDKQIHYSSKGYTDYRLENNVFTVVKDLQVIGYYNMDYIKYIWITDEKEDDYNA